MFIPKKEEVITLKYKVTAKRRADITRRLLIRLLRLQNNPAQTYLEKARHLMGYGEDPDKVREADRYLNKVSRINQQVSEEKARIELALKSLKGDDESIALRLLSKPLPKFE
jgi:hypothetical protein